jgi:hypothetical protein
VLTVLLLATLATWAIGEIGDQLGIAGPAGHVSAC